jgi:outer membrane protein assembly factor BamB
MTKVRFSVAVAIFALNSGFAFAQFSEDRLAPHSHRSTDWPRYSFDYSNSNNNPFETVISRRTAPLLHRAWETFNDSQWRAGAPPTGFALEAAVGLRFRSTVVGVVSLPLVIDGTIYYVDQLGTMFARDVKTGAITDPQKHWTTTLVDPDYMATAQPVTPDLYYTAPAATQTHIWIRSSVNGRVHAVRRMGGQEEDFDPNTPGIQPYRVPPDLPLSSNLGEPVIVHVDAKGRVVDALSDAQAGHRILLISEQNVILQSALLPGGQAQTGIISALDITDPQHVSQFWRTSTIDINPATGGLYGSGASAGSGLAVDTSRGWIFGGTGQNAIAPYTGYPDPANAPAGYVDRADSVYAIDILTGRFVWSNQFHKNDVFDLNHPVSTGPNRLDGPRDSDVLSPPVLFSGCDRGECSDFVAAGSKGGLFRAIDRHTGQTAWERQIAKPSGLGAIQAGAAYADGVIYVAGFEGIDDGFADANFNAHGSKYFNAFFATFSAQFWADVENTRDDGRIDTGMQVKLFALDAMTGKSVWRFSDGSDFVLLKAGATLRHVSIANQLIYLTTTSGELFILDSHSGRELFHDQTMDLNLQFGLGLTSPHHAAMNAGAVIANGMVFVPYGGQNEPSGGIIAYRIDQ